MRSMIKDNLVLAGPIEEIYKLTGEIFAKYKVGKWIINDTIQFNGCKITQDQRVTLSWI